MRSVRTLFSLSGERTSAGRCFTALRSVNGNGTRTTSPWLKLVVDGILGVIPEFEGRLGCFEPGDIVRLNFQMRRQIVKQLHLVAYIQVFDGVADLLNRAHAFNVAQTFLDAKSKEQPLALLSAEPQRLQRIRLKAEVVSRSLPLGSTATLAA
jgi:hypothetical protein